MATSGVGAKMKLAGRDEIISAYISNDYLGMSQRSETIEAGIDALRKYGTGACAAQAIGGYLDIHHKLEKEIAEFVMIEYLRYYADSNVFSAAITPQVTCSVLKALELIKTNPEIRQKLWSNVNYLRNRLKRAGFDIGQSESPIFPIMVRDNEKVYKIADMLQKKCIFASGIVYPAVRTKEARIRISILASHEIEQLEELAKALEEIRSVIPF